ncbi:pilus assembly protein PilX [Ferrimonas sediminicola]|uniref:Pilus assembly protein PilX n=1 Tax=Ferrimonas sediminicola TaxID=2569538 RepID=A0A4U1BDV3_9GAMM|nr:pilus assembly protein PilX [Ferrimonas sediminicola]TKB48781.1 pilus assembly protein PilX [Ferrimonas sediminicola]
MKRQGGVVLMVSIFILMVLMILGLSLSSNSRVTMMGTAASTARQQALQQARGAQEGFVERQRLARAGSLLLTNSGAQILADTVFSAQHRIDFIAEGPCKRSAEADSGSSFLCRTNEISSRVSFGKGGRGSLSVTTGIEQQVLLVGN